MQPLPNFYVLASMLDRRHEGTQYKFKQDVIFITSDNAAVG
jgi:hypothetical protein